MKDKPIDREKLASIGQLRSGRKTATRTIPHRHEQTGGLAGWQTEHWSDRVDATITPPHVRVKATVREVSEHEYPGSD